MRSKKVIWLLVLSMLFGLAAPTGTLAETQDTTFSLNASASAADTNSETAAESMTETSEAVQETAEETEAVTESETAQNANDETADTDETFSGNNDSGSYAETEASATGETQNTASTDLVDDEFANEITDEEIADSEFDSNADLIAAQNIILPEDIEMYYEFRYTQVENPTQAFLKQNSKVYEEGSLDGEVIGMTLTGSIVYILANEDEDWVYIESGEVRGFVQRDDLTTENLDQLLAVQENDPYTYMDCTSIGNPMYNAALTYTLTTAYDPIVTDPIKAVVWNDVYVYDRKNIYDENAVVVGNLKEYDLCYILTDEDQPIVYIESGDVRGFVDASCMVTGDNAESIIAERGESNMETAEQYVDPQDNAAIHYTLTSTKEANANAGIRTAIVKFAQQFVGNPYVWGGTSLLYGADCSGFCQQVYKYFGYSLPRTSRSQSQYGTQIPVSSAMPGDLIFYAKDGVVYHVAMYIGDGLTVQARGQKWGIVVCGIGYNAVWATRIIE